MIDFKNKTGLWAGVDKNGNKYLKGKAKTDIKAGTKLFVYKNEFKKEGEKTPDYNLMTADDDAQASPAIQNKDDIAF